MPYSNDQFKDECCVAYFNEKEVDLLDNIPSADNLSEQHYITSMSHQSVTLDWMRHQLGNTLKHPNLREKYLGDC